MVLNELGETVATPVWTTGEATGSQSFTKIDERFGGFGHGQAGAGGLKGFGHGIFGHFWDPRLSMNETR